MVWAVAHTIGDPARLLCIISLVAAMCLLLARAWVSRSKLSHIPTVGPSGIFSSYVGAYHHFFRAKEYIQRGYDQYPHGAFKIPTMSKWLVVVNSKSVDEIRKASDDYLSANEALSEGLEIDYTLGPELRLDPYHVAVIGSPVTKNLNTRFDDVQDEISVAFSDFVPEGSNWVTLPALKTIMDIVCRTSNRLFVDLPLCRNPEYLALNQELVVELFKAGAIINMFPNFLKPFVSRLFRTGATSTARAINLLGPIIQDRLDKEKEHGPHWPGKPNDLITWLLQYAKPDRRSIRDLVLHVLAVNFGAIHTTSMTFTQVLINLAVYPDYVSILRDEVEAVIDAEGFTFSALGKMRKLDSFIKESQRICGVGGVSMGRKAMKDFTFSDGTFIPAGTTIVAPTYFIHHDKNIYPNPEEFDGLRFFKMRENRDESTKHQMVSLSLDFLAFGHGRHACPGRFFAANELKAMLIHVLMRYDVKLPHEGVVPANIWYTVNIAPDPAAKVMLRRRAELY